VRVYTDQIKTNNSRILELEYLVEKQYEEYAKLVSDKEKVQSQIVDQGEVMSARIQGLREMTDICERDCRVYMEDKGDILAESARQLDKDRKEMLDR
jgi:hypothetical protein